MSVLTDIVSQFYGNFFLVKLQFYVTFLTGLFITFILFYLKKNKYMQLPFHLLVKSLGQSLSE